MNYPPLEAIYFRDLLNSHIPEILDEIYTKKVYHRFLTGKRDLTIVDVGANIGLTAFFFKDYAKRVICLEPSKMHRETLQEMLKFNKITNVEVLPYALSNKAGIQKLYLSGNSTAYTLTQLMPDLPSEDIETITIDDLFRLTGIEKIDFMKMDSEGEEAKIFMSNSFKRNMDKIPVIAGEYHDWSGVNPLQFMNILKDYGYDFIWNHNTQAATFSAEKI